MNATSYAGNIPFCLTGNYQVQIISDIPGETRDSGETRPVFISVMYP
jgi:hypothetical protein